MKSKLKTVKIKWFLSYIIILTIPIILSIGIYTYSLRITQEQSNKMNDVLMGTVKNEIDNHINEINKLFDRIALDTDVQYSTNIKRNFTAKDQYRLYNLVDNLQNLNLSDDFVEDIFVYFNNTGTVSSIKGNMSDELFYHLYYENRDYDLIQFRELMNKKYVRDIIPIHKLNGENVLMFATTTLDSSIGEKSGTIVITVNVRSLDKIMENMKWDKDIDIFILNSNNEIINNFEQTDWSEELKYEDIKEDDHFIENFNDTKYIVSVDASKTMDWKYICMSPSYLIEKSAKSIHYFSMAGLFICIFVGAYFSYVLVKTNYNPLKGIIELFKWQDNKGKDAKVNEYQWLKEQVELFFHEHMNNKQTLWNNKKVLKNYYLFKLLEYPYDRQNGLIEYQKYGLKLNGSYNIVVLLEVSQKVNEDSYNEVFNNNLNLHTFIIANIFEETVGNHFNLEVVEMGNKTAAIINLSDNNIECLEILKELIYLVQQNINEHFKFHTIALIGDIQEGLEGIHNSFISANEAAEYIQLLDTEIIYFDDIKNLQRRYYYPMDIEEKIINTIKVGDKVTAGNYIHNILKANCKDNYNIGNWRCLIFDMMGTLMKGADLSGCGNVLEDIDIAKELHAKLPVSELEEKFQKYVNLVCDNALEKQGENENNAILCNKITQYIKENYNDPDLNISLTGLHFSITPAYLSTIFKKQTGESLLEYINDVRIGKAKEFLEQGISVVDTAERVGFRNSGAFIRVFKKKTGITPGQLKKIT